MSPTPRLIPPPPLLLPLPDITRQVAYDLIRAGRIDEAYEPARPAQAAYERGETDGMTL